MLKINTCAFVALLSFFGAGKMEAGWVLWADVQFVPGASQDIRLQPVGGDAFAGSIILNVLNNFPNLRVRARVTSLGVVPVGTWFVSLVGEGQPEYFQQFQTTFVVPDVHWPESRMGLLRLSTRVEGCNPASLPNTGGQYMQAGMVELTIRPANRPCDPFDPFDFPPPEAPGDQAWPSMYWKEAGGELMCAWVSRDPTASPISIKFRNPEPISLLSQLKSDGHITIPVGGTTDESTVVFKANVSDLDGDKVKLQIELRRLNEYEGKFLNEFTQESEFVNSGSQVTVSANGLVNGNYHWQARTVDEDGLSSEWVEFGNNDILDADFMVKQGQEPPPEQPMLKSPWRGVARITQGNNGSTSHYDHGAWDNTYAIDVGLPVGSDVLAPADGEVNYIDDDPTGAGGREIAIEHTGPNGDKFITVYLHLDKIFVKSGHVDQGQTIAKSGKTGNVAPHLHFHMWNRIGSRDSHTMAIQRLEMKQVGAESDFREYDATKGDLNDAKLAGKYFESSNAPATITITAHSPIDLVVNDPSGYATSKQSNEIPGAAYLEYDIDDDGELEDRIWIANAMIGTYRISIVPDPGTSSMETYGLEVVAGDKILILADDVPISNIPHDPYVLKSTEAGIEVVTVQPVEGFTKLTVGRAAFDAKTKQFSANVTVANTSNTAIGSPVWLVIESISNPAVTVANASGTTSNGKSYIDLSNALGDGKLSPNEKVIAQVRFHNPKKVAFTFKPSVYGVVLN
jgi:murein DD-endopeptidase MepM/ murein hydrolase activator NlpD